MVEYDEEDDGSEDDPLQYVLDCIESEGFDYAFVNYSHFEQIEDEEFHRLRKAFLAAREALANYVGAD